MAEDLTLGLAFIAGLVSFISPCVLPLVPAYVGYMGGQATATVSAAIGGGGSATVAQRDRFGTFLHGIFFVLGFTLVFVAFGLLITAGSLTFDIRDVLTRLGGLLIIVFAFHVMGYLPRWMNWVLGKTAQMNSGTGYVITLLVQVAVAAVLAWGLAMPVLILVGVGAYLVWLVIGGAFTRPGDFWEKALIRLQTWIYADTRQQVQPRSDAGYAGSVLMGMVFSAGWTPCIGPVYGAILTLAASGDSLGRAGALLLAYSLGLGVPFLLTALALDRMQGFLRRLQRHMRKIELVSGVLLLLIGFLVLTNQLQRLSQFGASGVFAYNLELCTTELFNGHLSVGDFGACLNGELDLDALGAGEAGALSTAAIGYAAVSPLENADEAGGGVLDTLQNLDEVSVTGEGAANVDQPDVGLGEGFLAPGFETTTLEERAISLADFRGQVVVVNFWATWCGPCRAEMPHLQAAYEARADEGLVILGINRGETPGQVSAFRDEQGLTFPLLLDQSEVITHDYQVRSMPTTYVLDANGVIVATHLGAMTAAQLDGYLADAFAASD